MAKKPTKAAVGWGIRHGDPDDPHLEPDFFTTRKQAENWSSGWRHHRAVRVAIVPLAVAKKVGLV